MPCQVSTVMHQNSPARWINFHEPWGKKFWNWIPQGLSVLCSLRHWHSSSDSSTAKCGRVLKVAEGVTHRVAIRIAYHIGLDGKTGDYFPTGERFYEIILFQAKGSANWTTACVQTSTLPNSTSFVPDNGGSDYSSCETGYRFDSVRDETTIVTEWSLVCEREYLRYLSTALYLCGGIIGAWIAGVLVDRVGRLPVLALCLYTQGTLAVALYIIQVNMHTKIRSNPAYLTSTYYPLSAIWLFYSSSRQDYRAFLVVRALQGVFVQGLQISTYTLLLELFPVRMKLLVGMTTQFALAIGLALLAGLSYAVADWRVLQLATSVPTAITVLYIW